MALDQWNHLRTKLLDANRHCLLEVGVRASRKESRIEDNGSTIEKMVERKDLSEENEMVFYAWILVLRGFDLCPRDMEE